LLLSDLANYATNKTTIDVFFGYQLKLSVIQKNNNNN